MSKKKIKEKKRKEKKRRERGWNGHTRLVLSAPKLSPPQYGGVGG